jgi:DNA-binding MarR family transcriptional regulator
VQDIAEELAITVGGASKVVDRIAAAGHCVRRPNPGDRRSSLIELTPAGERVLAAATASYTGELDRRLGGALGRAEVRDLTATLSRLRKAVAA